MDLTSKPNSQWQKSCASTGFCHMELQKRLASSPTNDHGHAAFLSYMSHELRTPLNAIIGFTGMLKILDDCPELGEKRGEYVDGIDQSAQHLLQVVKTMLSYMEKACEDQDSLNSKF